MYVLSLLCLTAPEYITSLWAWSPVQLRFTVEPGTDVLNPCFHWQMELMEVSVILMFSHQMSQTAANAMFY